MFPASCLAFLKGSQITLKRVLASTKPMPICLRYGTLVGELQKLSQSRKLGLTLRNNICCLCRSVDFQPSRYSAKVRSPKTTKEAAPVETSSRGLWICSLTTLLLLNCWRSVHLCICVIHSCMKVNSAGIRLNSQNWARRASSKHLLMLFVILVVLQYFIKCVFCNCVAEHNTDKTYQFTNT